MFEEHQNLLTDMSSKIWIKGDRPVRLLRPVRHERLWQGKHINGMRIDVSLKEAYFA